MNKDYEMFAVSPINAIHRSGGMGQNVEIQVLFRKDFSEDLQQGSYKGKLIGIFTKENDEGVLFFEGGIIVEASQKYFINSNDETLTPAETQLLVHAEENKHLRKARATGNEQPIPKPRPPVSYSSTTV